MENEYVQGQVWDEDYLDRFNVGRLKKDLASRVVFSGENENLKVSIDFNKMVELGKSKYSDSKVSRALLKSLGEYHCKEPGEVGFFELAKMYCSIRSIFGKEVSRSDITNWKEKNKLSFFGPVQYELMQNYFYENFPEGD